MHFQSKMARQFALLTIFLSVLPTLLLKNEIAVFIIDACFLVCFCFLDLLFLGFL